MKKTIITVKKQDQDQRLDVFLVKKISGISRVVIQKTIKEQMILVNNKAVKSSYSLREDDKIKIAGLLNQNNTSIKAESDVKFKVIYEDTNFMVINKPAGLIVHPTAIKKTGTLVNGLLYCYPKLKYVGENDLRPGIVHRLDKDTSGLMLIAKNNSSFVFLKNLFKERKITKKYKALVYGRLKKRIGEIRLPIKRSSRRIGRQSIDSKEGREAYTKYRILKEYNNFSLIEVEPKTGRMHQIRVHLASIGHPIAGDRLYKFKRQKCRIDIGRQFLHSFYLKFNFYGKRMEYKVSLADDLRLVLNHLK